MPKWYKKNTMKFKQCLYILIFTTLTLGCASTKKEQLPAPHNNYTGLTVDEYFRGEGAVNSEMMRA